MIVQPYTIDNEAEAKAYLTDLLKHPENQSMDVVGQRCATLVKDPVIKTYFLAKGAELLADLKDQA